MIAMYGHFLLLLSVVSFSNAQLFEDRACPEIPARTAKDFTLSKALGTWYQHKTYYLEHERDLKCIEVDFSVSPEGENIMTTKGYHKKTNAVLVTKTIGTSLQTDTLLYNAVGISPSFGNRTMRCRVVDIDYGNFAIGHCSQEIGARMCVQCAWVWTRERRPTEYCKDAINKSIEKNGLSPDDFHETDQSNCHEHDL